MMSPKQLRNVFLPRFRQHEYYILVTAEAIGLVSSIIAVAQAVAESVRLVVELYRAPAEVKTLQVG